MFIKPFHPGDIALVSKHGIRVIVGLKVATHSLYTRFESFYCYKPYKQENIVWRFAEVGENGKLYFNDDFIIF